MCGATIDSSLSSYLTVMGSSDYDGYLCPAAATKLGKTYTYNEWVVSELRLPDGAYFTGDVKFTYGTGCIANDKGMFHSLGVSNYNMADPIYLVPVGRCDSIANQVTVPPGEHRNTIFANLRCAAPTCVGSDTWTEMYDVHLNVTDPYPPTALWNGGTLFASGSVSGTKQANALGIDTQSGIRSMTVSVNGTQVAAVNTCPTPAKSFVPCGVLKGDTFNLDTTTAPFHEGSNTVSLCVKNYPSDSGCESKTVVVDN